MTTPSSSLNRRALLSGVLLLGTGWASGFGSEPQVMPGPGLAGNGFNPVPGHAIRNIVFSDITYSGAGPVSSTVKGYDEARDVQGVVFHNIHYQGRTARAPEDFNLNIGRFAGGVTVRSFP